jgi:hypothetical protein
MQKDHLQGRVFNPDAWGGYMELNTPELKPFTDGRQDIFLYNGTFQDYIRAVTMQSPVEVLNKYKFDYVLAESRQPMAYLLAHSTDWREVYSDNVAVIFERADVEAPPQ